MTVIEVGFKEEEEVDEKEPLLMEHFHLPFGIWFVGIPISILCFVAEIIHHRIQVSRTKHLGEIILNKWKAGKLSDTEAAEADQVQVPEVPDKARVTLQQEHNNTDVQDTEEVEEVEEVEV